jgi:hypothetical protein
MLLLWNMNESAMQNAFTLTWIALICCLLLLYGHFNATFSTSATAQALLWGIFVFPTMLLIVLLVSLLPDGISTLAVALGLQN